MIEKRDAGSMIIGICLGAQIMPGSEEDDCLDDGLGWFKGRVKKFPLHYNLLLDGITLIINRAHYLTYRDRTITITTT